MLVCFLCWLAREIHCMLLMVVGLMGLVLAVADKSLCVNCFRIILCAKSAEDYTATR